MKYKCLVLDHDDTAVKSTPEIHYPIYLRTIKMFKPDHELMSMEDFMRASFYPGLYDYYLNVLKLTKEQLDEESRIWHEQVKNVTPHFHEGFDRIVFDFKKAGGVIAVSTQSHREVVLRDYKERLNFIPDFVYGYEDGLDKIKPNPYPIFDIEKKTGIKPSEILMIDDLRTGLEMAKAGGCDFVASGWSHFVPEIRDYMKANSKHYFSTTEELYNFIFNAI